MKRVLLGFPIFLIAFFAGYLMVADLRTMLADQRPPDTAMENPYKNGNQPIVVNDSAMISLPNVANPQTQPIDRDRDLDEFSEAFTNDTRIGRPRKNKVEIKCYERGNGMIAEITFYSRSNSGAWQQKQSFEFEKDNVTNCDPKVEDFNNDGLKDFTYKSNVAARGANEIRTLFIYDKAKNELVHIKNSEHYPNLAYNKKLDCLDAWLFHGATTTVFLRIEGDELADFASVDTGAELVVTLRGKYGRREISRKRMPLEDIYTRYSSFDPPRP